MAINNIDLKEIMGGIKNMYSESLLNLDPTLSNCTNLTGYNAAIPSLEVSDTTLISQNNFNPFQFNGNDVEYPITVAPVRYMQSQDWNLGDICNMYFCVFNGNYTVRAWKDSTTVYKNGSSQGTITTAGGTLALNSLIKGDRIEFNKPSSFYYAGGLPGLSGAYGGYAGYCFGTRNDRQATATGNQLTFFVVDGGVAEYNGTPEGMGVAYTTTDDSNVTSMTIAYEEVWQAPYDMYSTNIAITRNYVATSKRLMCAWRGFINTALYDSFPMYPMTTEPKYGWYSQGGHILAAAGPYQKRDNGSSTFSVYTKTSAVSATNEFSTSNNSAWYRGDKNTGANSGAGFSGSPAVTYINGGPNTTTGAGPLFTAESQGDGNGTEMTSHTGEAAHERHTVCPGSADWAAFIAANIANGKGVIMRFNSSGTWQNSLQISGYSNTTSYPWASCRFTNTSANDSFFSTVNVQGYADMDSTDDDETNLIMGEDTDFYSSTSYSFTYDEETDNGGRDTSTEACAGMGNPTTITVYSPMSGTPTAGHVYFLDSTFDTPIEEIFSGFDVAGSWYRIPYGRSTYTVQFANPSCGLIDAVVAC